MELEWVQTYYHFMRNNNEVVKNQQKIMRYYRENEKLEFCQVQNVVNPVLLYKYEELGQEFINVFYINNDNVVKEITGFSKYADVQCLFDIEDRKFDYFIHEKNGNEDLYTKISDAITADNYNKKVDLIDIDGKNYREPQKFSFQKEEKSSVTAIDGRVIEISKFDEKFIKTNMVEMNWNNLNLNTYEDGIKKDFKVAVNNMMHELTEEEQDLIYEKERETNNKKQEMKDALEEIERVKKEEEEKSRQIEEALKKAEEERLAREEEERLRAVEEARNSIANSQNTGTEQNRIQPAQNIGNYSLSYGTYKGIDYSTPGDSFSKYEITIVLKEDGTYSQVNLITVAGITETYTGTYTIINDTNIGPIIRFSITDSSYLITGNNQFTSLTGSGEIIKLVQ